MCVMGHIVPHRERRERATGGKRSRKFGGLMFPQGTRIEPLTCLESGVFGNPRTVDGNARVNGSKSTKNPAKLRVSTVQRFNGSTVQRFNGSKIGGAEEKGSPESLNEPLTVRQQSLGMMTAGEAYRRAMLPRQPVKDACSTMAGWCRRITIPRYRPDWPTPRGRSQTERCHRR